MTYENAIEKLYSKYPEKPTIVKGIEFNKYFAFFITIPGANKEEKNFVGGDMICVQKISGEIFKESIADADFKEAVRYYENVKESTNENH